MSVEAHWFGHTGTLATPASCEDVSTQSGASVEVCRLTVRASNRTCCVGSVAQGQRSASRRRERHYVPAPPPSRWPHPAAAAKSSVSRHRGAARRAEPSVPSAENLHGPGADLALPANGDGQPDTGVPPPAPAVPALGSAGGRTVLPPAPPSAAPPLPAGSPLHAARPHRRGRQGCSSHPCPQ